MTLPRALVVADDRYVLRLLSRVLTDSCELSLARDCGEALARIESQRFELVLTHLHGRGSLDVLCGAKARLPDTDVIVLVEDEARDAAEAAYALGAYECLAPFDPQSIAHAVERAVEHGALRSDVARFRRELGQGRGSHA